MVSQQVGSAIKDVPAEGVVHAALAKKQPPPESPQGVKTRRWIIFSFWAIVGLLGLPIWFATTTVPRAALPLESMDTWASGQVCLALSLYIMIFTEHQKRHVNSSFLCMLLLLLPTLTLQPL